ncbi:MAG: PAS domain-containing protein [Crocinitomicaceae bacterium]
MIKKSEYDKLVESYRDLQLRVTRFSNVEQELINIRDQLDDELNIYKRLSQFNADSFKVIAQVDFLKLVSEAIIDLFELECSVVYFKSQNQENYTNLLVEGFNLPAANNLLFEEQTRQLVENLASNKTSKISVESFANLSLYTPFHEGVAFVFTNNIYDYSINLIGLVTKKHAPLYDPIETRDETIFEVFAHQVKSHIENRLKEEKINAQLLDISKSRIELKKLSMIATKTKNSVVISDRFGNIEWVNKAFEEVTGYQKEEVIGKKPKEFLQGPSSDEKSIQKISSSLKKKQNVEVTILNYKKDKKAYYNQLEIIPIFDENEELINFISLQKDITEETKFKQEILKINSRFELIAQKTNIGIWEWDDIQKTIHWNDVLIDMYGVRRSDVEPELFDFWKASLHPEDRERIIAEVDDLISDKITDSLVQDYRIRRYDNQEERILKCHVIAERNPDGKMIRLIGTATDNTEIKRFEDDILEKNDELKKINAELDNFVYRVSHDLRSPLLSIKGILSLLFLSGNLTEETISYLKLAESSVIRLDETIQEILEYSRNARLEMTLQSFDVEEVVRQVYEDLKFSTDTSIRFDCDFNGSSIITSDKSRIEILVKNLMGNAFKYKRNDISNPFVRFNMSMNDQEIQLSFEDNGEGIEEKHLDKIFDMFYRASSQSQGTGLGLYICKEIATKLNGSITLSSQPKKGTTVQIKLPIINL